MVRDRGVRGRYTPMGKRIAKFGPQHVLAGFFGVSQQTVSKKLRGECVISVPDLERLARRLKIPIGAFFSAAEQACEWACSRCSHKRWVTYADLVPPSTPICPTCRRQLELID